MRALRAQRARDMATLENPVPVQGALFAQRAALYARWFTESSRRRARIG